MTHRWALHSSALTFQIAEMRLFRVRLPLLVCSAYFTELTDDPDVTCLPHLPLSAGIQGLLVRSHPTKTSLARIRCRGDAIRYVPSQYKHYYVDLHGSFDDYLAGLSSKSRSTLKRKVRKFTKASGGRICWHEFAHVDEMMEFHRLAREVSVRTYQETRLEAGLPDDDQFKAHMICLARSSRVRGYILFFEGKPISYIYCPSARDGILLYDYVGYDLEYGKLSPGTVLMYLVLQKLFADDSAVMFDFEEGEGQHKEVFANGQVYCANIYYLRPTVRNVCLVVLHTILHLLSRAAAGALQWLGLKRRIKRLLRKR